jgi:hypothetical protein
MRSHSASIQIAAEPAAIWSILTDGARFPEWEPASERVEGSIAPGEKVKFFIKSSPARAFPVRVTTFDPPKRLVFTGGMPLGLFRGLRTQTLAAMPDGSTRFTIREEFSGPLEPLIGRSIPDLTPIFEAYAAALKARAEHAG